MMHSLPRKGMNRGERALLASSLHLSPLLLQWAKTEEAKRPFAGKERRMGGKEAKWMWATAGGFGALLRQPRARLVPAGFDSSSQGKSEAFSSVRSAFPLNWDHVGCNGNVRESIWNESAVNPHLLPWKRKWMISRCQTVARQRLKMVS